MPEKKPSFFSRFGKKKNDEIAIYENIAESAAEEDAAPEAPVEAWSQAGYEDAEISDAEKAKAAAEKEAAAKETAEKAAHEAAREAELALEEIDPFGEALDRFVPKFVPMKKVRKLPLKTLYITAACIAFVIISLAVATVLVVNMNKSPYPDGSVLLTLPKADDTNRNSYIFTSKELKINGFDAKLQGVTLNSTASVFYFNRYFDAGCMDFTITDSENNVYYLDLSRHIDGGRTDRLYFEPLKEGIESFELNLPEYFSTGYDDTFFFFNKPLEYTPVLYAASQSAVLDFDGDKAAVNIDEAVFSPVGAFINYSLIPDGKIQILPEDTTAPLKFTGDKSVFPALEGYAAQSELDGAGVMGRVGFWPPDSLKGEATVTIDNLLCEIQMNKIIQTDELFLNDPAYAQTVKLADYELVLERMGKRANVYILVLHTTDTRLPQPKPGDYSNRAYAKYDIELIGYDKNGKEVALKPMARVFKKGSDYIFVDNDNEIIYSSPQDVSLRINSAQIKIDSIDFDIDLSTLSDKRDERSKKAIDAILAEYKNRNKDVAQYTVQAVGVNITDNKISALIYEAGVKDGQTFTSKYAVTGDIINGGVTIATESKI